MGRCRVLVVDDYADSAESMRLLLQLFGHVVQIARDGLEAVDSARDFQPDVILMDLGLPKLDGCDAARRIREQPWGKSIVLVALTGWAQDSIKQRTTEAGFDYHLIKPVDPVVLEKILQDLCLKLSESPLLIGSSI